MGLRTWKYLTVTSGTPQPFMGTFTAAAIVGSPNSQVVAVVDASQFVVGDRILVDSGVAAAELVRITAISSNNITGVFLNNHLTAAPVHLFWPCTFVYAQTKDGNVGAIYLGNKKTMVIATGVGVVMKMLQVVAGNQPTDFSSANVFGANPDNTASYWVDGGSTGDSYLPTAVGT